MVPNMGCMADGRCDPASTSGLDLLAASASHGCLDAEQGGVGQGAGSGGLPAPEIALKKSSLQRIRVWIPSETGKSEICFSCGHRLKDTAAFKCSGCSVRIHRSCLSETRFSDVDEAFVFECGLCRNARIQSIQSSPICSNIVTNFAQDQIDFSKIKQPKKRRFTGSNMASSRGYRCASCHENQCPQNLAICGICGYFICGDRCAVMASSAKLDKDGIVSFEPGQDFACILCNRKNFKERLTKRLIQCCAEANSAYDNQDLKSPNHPAIRFFSMMFDAQNQSLWDVLKQFSDMLPFLLKKEIEFISKNETSSPHVFPSMLLDQHASEKEISIIAVAASKTYYSGVIGEDQGNTAGLAAITEAVLSPPAGCIEPTCTSSSTAQDKIAQSTKEHISFVTTDGVQSHPTIYLVQGLIVALCKECNLQVKVYVYLETGSRVDDTMLFIESGIGGDNVIYKKSLSSPSSFIQDMLESDPNFVVFLDGHTGNINELWNAWEMHVSDRKLPIFLAVWLAYPGVYGQKSFTIACPGTVRDPEACGNAKIALLPACYHISSALLDPNLRKRDPSHTKESYGFHDTDKLLVFPGRLGRIDIETFDVWLQILRKMTEFYARTVTMILKINVKLVLFLHSANLISCLTFWEHAEENGVDPSHIVVVQGMNREDHQQRLMSLATLVLDTVVFQGLHTLCSESIALNKLVITQRGETFRRNVGAAILDAVGLGELVSKNKEEYSEIVCHLLENEAFRLVLEDKISISNLLKTAVFDNTSTSRHFLALCRKGQQLMHGQARTFSVEPTTEVLTASDEINYEKRLTYNSILSSLEDVSELSHALSTKSLHSVLKFLSGNQSVMSDRDSVCDFEKKMSLIVLGSGLEYLLAFAAVTGLFRECFGLVNPSAFPRTQLNLQTSLKKLTAEEICLHSKCTVGALEETTRETQIPVKLTHLVSNYISGDRLSTYSVILLCDGMCQPEIEIHLQNLACDRTVTRIALMMNGSSDCAYSDIADNLNRLSKSAGSSSFRQIGTHAVKPYSIHGKSMKCYWFFRDTESTPDIAMCDSWSGETKSASEVTEKIVKCSESHTQPPKLKDEDLASFLKSMNVTGLVFADIHSGQPLATDIAGGMGASITIEHRSLCEIFSFVKNVSMDSRNINFASTQSMSKCPNLAAIFTWLSLSPPSQSLRNHPIVELMRTSRSLSLVGMLIPNLELYLILKEFLASTLSGSRLNDWRIEEPVTMNPVGQPADSIIGLIIRRGGNGACAAQADSLAEPQPTMPLPSDLTLLLLKNSESHKPIRHLIKEARNLASNTQKKKLENTNTGEAFLSLEEVNQASGALFESNPLLNLTEVLDSGGFGVIVGAKYKEESIVLKLEFQKGTRHIWNLTLWREQRLIHSIRNKAVFQDCVPRLVYCLSESPLGVISFHQGRLAILAMERLETISEFLGNVHAYVQQNQRFENDRIRFFVTGVLEAVNALHSSGYAHGDIKPRNILFRGESEVVLIDFGVSMKTGERYDSRRYDSRRSKAETARVATRIPPRLIVPLNNIVNANTMPSLERFGRPRTGTVGYRPPEEVANHTQMLCSDMWQVGVLLLQLIWRPESSNWTDYEKDVAKAVKDSNRDFSKFLIEVNRRRKSELKEPDEGLKAWDESVLRLLQLVHSCLDLNSERRCTAATALLSSFVVTPI